MKDKEVEKAFKSIKPMFDLVSKYIDTEIVYRTYYGDKYKVITKSVFNGLVVYEDIVKIETY